MPVLGQAIELLGLRVDVVRSTATAMLAAADQAMRTSEPRRGEVSDYVAAHALRGIGLSALVDQDSAREAALDATRWLAAMKHPAWPLAAAALDHRTVQGLLHDDGVVVHHPIEAVGYPGELLQLAAGDVDREPGPDASPDPAYSRAGLVPYGIDIRLLHATVRGGNTTQVGYISEPSAPAVVGVLLGSVQDALDLARADRKSWAVGAATIAATDPEILLTLRALRRSPSRFGLEFGTDGRPQLQAALMVIDRLDPW